MSEYIIYRDKASNKITSYSIIKNKQPEKLDDLITEYNLTHNRIAERAASDDIKSLIEIAEANKLLKQDDIKSIEFAFDNLQTEIYNLKDRFKL